MVFKWKDNIVCVFFKYILILFFLYVYINVLDVLIVLYFVYNVVYGIVVLCYLYIDNVVDIDSVYVCI